MERTCVYAVIVPIWDVRNVLWCILMNVLWAKRFFVFVTKNYKKKCFRIYLFMLRVQIKKVLSLLKNGEENVKKRKECRGKIAVVKCSYGCQLFVKKKLR